jgi:NodT family efflux transporter outer membrane factor (OMF) lipoprotein
MRRLIAGLMALSLFSGGFAPVLAKPAASPKKDPTPTFQSGIQWTELPDGQPTAPLTTSATFPDPQWWQRFQDPHLTRYMEEALADSPDLQLAGQRVAEARHLARQRLGEEFPTVGVQPAFTRQRNSKSLLVPSIAQFERVGPRLFAPGATVNIYNVPLQVNYDLDLWGKHRLTTKAQNKQVVAAQADQQAVFIGLTTEVATAYFNLLKADRLAALQAETIALLKDKRTLVQAQYDAGLIAYDAVDRAQAAVQEAEALLPDFQKQQALFAHQLGILRGKLPVTADQLPRASLDTLPLEDAVPVGVPSQLVARRPDVKAALARLESARLSVSVAKRNLLPSFPITGQFGFASTSLDKIFNWDSYLASIAPAMAQTLFAGGAKRAAVRVAKSQYDQALTTYQQTTLQAFLDVEDALASLKANSQQLQLSDQRQATLKEAHALVADRYQAGIIPYQDVIDALTPLLASQKALVEEKATVLTDRISLYKALGGGF